MSSVRWTVVVLLFFAVTINYVDRAVIGVLKPLLDEALGWDQKDYGWMVTAFQAAYAVGYAVSGRLLDRFGIRLGFSVAVALWSVAAMAHGAMTSVVGFSAARAALGLAEGGTLPAAVKAVSEWFPKEQRAFATGVFNAGSNVGAITCPIVVPWLASRWGWEGAFVVTGAIGFLWLAAWLWIYRSPDQHPRVNAEELAYIRQDPPDPPRPPLPWAALLGRPQTWAFMIGMMASSPVWWFYIFWVPDFLNKRFGLGLTQSSLPLVTIFTIASLGGIAGGWLSSTLLRRGWTVNAARKTALLVCSVCILPVFLTPLVPVTHVWWAVAIVTLAAAAHCGYAANLFTLVSDTVPRQAVSSVVGIGGMAGSIAGMFFAQLVARVLDATNDNFFVPFAIAACSYSLALLAIHLLLPKLEPMDL
ncbi:MFS transporter [Luteitalea sp.]